ncbi:AraC family transcriptional regulator [Nocardia stercoris]|uniref:AraC family transcriptional regulator n=1 Tax=Nocardia stercoris TaxID=2483361 RepID=UPI00131A1C7F|nr:AraC family transcriptional regulator [Nocardia stercoris]
MNEPVHLRSVAGAALLVEFALSRGIPLSAILRHTGIPEHVLQDPNADITRQQELALTSNVVAALDDEPGLGLMAGLLCHPPSLGLLGFAMLSCPTLRHAAEIALRHADLLFTASRYTLQDHGSELWMVCDDHDIPPHLRRFTLERDLAAIATLQQDLIPIQVRTLRAEMPMAAHPIYEMFGALFGAEKIMFGAPRAILVWDARELDVRLPQGNLWTARYYEQECTDLIQRRSNRVGISGRVRQLLIRHGGVTDQTHIAADLDLSVRTLRRRLADEGTTFRELSTETIGLLAEELLTAGLTVEQVADRLGYSSVSAFATAFRSWKGQPPGHFARTHRGRTTADV